MAVTTPPVPTEPQVTPPEAPAPAPPEAPFIPGENNPELAPPAEPLPPPPDPNLPPPPAADPAQVEAMVAVIGIDKIINRIRKVHLYHIDRAAKLNDEIARNIYSFLGRTEPAESADLPPWDFEQVREDLQTLPTPQHTADVIGAFGDHADTGLAAVRVAETVQTFLVQKIPHRVHQSIAGPIQETPPHSELARFRRIWNVAIDPIAVIMEALNEFALSRDMVEAFAGMFPLTWAMTGQVVDQQLARKKAAQPKFQLTFRKEQQLRILIKKEDATSKALGVALQAQFKKAAAEAAPKPPRAKTKGSAAIESTETDRIGNH